MESSSSPTPTGREAAAALAEAEAARGRLAHGIAAPAGFFAALGVVIAVQIATAAVGLGDDRPWLLAAGLALFAAAAAAQLAWFRRRNGVWLGGFASRVVLGSGAAASTWYALGLGGALWAAFEAQWWLVALCSIAGGAGYALSGRRWMHEYRARPAAHAGGEPAAWLAAFGVLAACGLVALLLLA